MPGRGAGGPFADVPSFRERSTGFSSFLVDRLAWERGEHVCPPTPSPL